MGDVATKPNALTVTGEFEKVANAPDPDDELVALCEDHINEGMRANVCISTDAGRKRTTLKSKVSEINDATADELIETLHHIAWAHCCAAGKRTRYCAEIFIQETGRSRPLPVRAYFELDPAGDTFGDDSERHDSKKSNAVYTHELERHNLRLIDRMRRDSQRATERAEQRENLSFEAIAKVAEAERRLATGRVDEIQESGRQERKGKLWGMLEDVFPRVLDHLLEEEEDEDEDEDELEGQGDGKAKKKGDGKAKKKKLARGGPVPMERLKKLLSTKELGALEKAIGADRWKLLEEATNLGEGKRAMSKLSKKQKKAVQAALPLAKILEIGEWRD